MYDVTGILESRRSTWSSAASERSVDDCVGSGHGIVFESYLIYERLHVLYGPRIRMSESSSRAWM
jgi:hypothetical protein